MSERPRISLMVAMARNRVIGRDGGLPWRLPDDLRHLKKTTMGKPVIMGRKTFESIGKKPLPGRRNVILTRTETSGVPDVAFASTPEAALEQAGPAEEIVILGGSGVYEAFLDRADRMYLTLVEAAPEGDTYFPEFDRNDWKETARVDHPADENHAHAFSFLTLERIGRDAP